MPMSTRDSSGAGYPAWTSQAGRRDPRPLASTTIAAGNVPSAETAAPQPMTSEAELWYAVASVAMVLSLAAAGW